MGFYDTRNEARRISKLASQNISSEQTKKEFELDGQSKFNQVMQAGTLIPTELSKLPI